MENGENDKRPNKEKITAAATKIIREYNTSLYMVIPSKNVSILFNIVFKS